MANYYVDATNGNDSNDGSIGSPWKTLLRVHSLNMSWSAGQPYPSGNYPYTPHPVSGDTVWYYTGSYGAFTEDSTVTGVWTVIHNTDWIIHKAMPGNTPEFSSIYILNEYQGDRGESYLEFDGIKINGGAYFTKSNHIFFKNCDISNTPNAITGTYAPYYDAGQLNDGINVTDGTDLIVQNCKIHNCHHGVQVNYPWSNTTISGNEVHRIAAYGIAVNGPDNSTISNNLVYDLDNRRMHVPMWGTVSNGSFTVGEVVNQASSGAQGKFETTASGRIIIFVTSTTNFDGVAGQTVHTGGTIVGATSGAVFTLSGAGLDPEHTDGISAASTTGGLNPGNINILGNKVLRLYPNDPWICNQTTFKLGAQEAEYMHDVTLENNVGRGTLMWGDIQGNVKVNNNTFYGGLLMNCSSGSNTGTFIIDQLYNNVFEDLTAQTDWSGRYTRVVAHGNNIFHNNPDGWGVNGAGYSYPFAVNATEQTGVTLNSLFVDAGNNDFNLIAGSLAINLGDAAYQPTTDILGYTRDATHHSTGAYEYNSGTVPTPQPPSAPSSITYPSSSATGIYSVSWATSDNTTSYQLERTDNGVTYTQVYSGANTAYSENLPIDSTYKYRVKATNSDGSSAYTTGSGNCVVTIPVVPPVEPPVTPPVTPPVVPPVVPKPFTPSAITYPKSSTVGLYTISWRQSNGSSSYRLGRSKDSGRSWSVIYTGTALSRLEKIASGRYRYRVCGVNSAGSSGYRTGTYDCVVRIPDAPKKKDNSNATIGIRSHIGSSYAKFN